MRKMYPSKFLLRLKKQKKTDREKGEDNYNYTDSEDVSKN